MKPSFYFKLYLSFGLLGLQALCALRATEIPKHCPLQYLSYTQKDMVDKNRQFLTKILVKQIQN